MRVLPDDPQYLADAAAEAAFWSAAPQGFGVESSEGAAASVQDFYTNERFTGDRRTTWFETIARRGTFRRGLALGTSGMMQDARILEGNPDLHMTFCDISEGALERWQRELGRRFPGRVTTQHADLNFVDLPSDAFDLIVSSSTIHHVTNLEHLAAQINGALTDDGTFYLQDYAGEARFRFSDEKKRTLEAAYREILTPGASGALTWSNQNGQYSPFCGVRSDETLAIMRDHLVETDLRTAAALLLPLLCAHPAEWSSGGLRRPPITSRIRHALHRRATILLRQPAPGIIPAANLEALMRLDAIVCDAGLLLPGNAFATYRKRR